MTSTVLTNCQVFNGKKFLKNHSVRIQGTEIQAVVPEPEIQTDEKTIDLEGSFLLPGLLDLQVYGGGGVLFAENLNLESLYKIEAFLTRTGTTGFLITIPSRPFSDIQKAVEVVGEYLKIRQGALLGLHVEGPFINPEKRGAHRLDWLKKPDENEVNWLISNGKGIVKFITLAPEMVSDDVIRRFVKAGFVVSAGHSATNYERYREGFSAGIRHVTHLFNAMPAFEGRKPALLGAASDSGEVFVSIIADGQHAHFPSVRMAKKIFGKRLYLITDAVTETDTLKLKNGAIFNESDILTGSALTMPLAISNCVREKVCSLEEAVCMASAAPAKVLGEFPKLGRIKKGARANFTVLTSDFRASQVFINGLPRL